MSFGDPFLLPIRLHRTVLELINAETDHHFPIIFHHFPSFSHGKLPRFFGALATPWMFLRPPGARGGGLAEQLRKADRVFL